jgi:hypothetical protein
MTKKDYELIARVLRETTGGPDMPGPLRDHIARTFAYELAALNPRFDGARFIAACMGQDSHDSAGRKVRYS